MMQEQLEEKSGERRDRYIDRARFNVPPNTSQVISGTGFYGSNDPISSIKALKEDRF